MKFQQKCLSCNPRIMKWTGCPPIVLTLWQTNIALYGQSALFINKSIWYMLQYQSQYAFSCVFASCKKFTRGFFQSHVIPLWHLKRRLLRVRHPRHRWPLPPSFGRPRGCSMSDVISFGPSLKKELYHTKWWNIVEQYVEYSLTYQWIFMEYEP